MSGNTDKTPKMEPEGSLVLKHDNAKTAGYELCHIRVRKKADKLFSDTAIKQLCRTKEIANAGAWGTIEKVFQMPDTGNQETYALKKAFCSLHWIHREKEWAKKVASVMEEEYDILATLGPCGGAFPEVYLFGYEEGSDHTGDTVNWPVLLEEWIEGVDLGEIPALAAGDERNISPLLNPRSAAAVACAILSALSTAHAKRAGTVHRDLSMKNIRIKGSRELVRRLVAEAGDMPVCILDFGTATKNWRKLAYVPEEMEDRVRSTSATGEYRMGTVEYGAPELFEVFDEDENEEKSCHPKVDVYSVGEILYHLTHGRSRLMSGVFGNPIGNVGARQLILREKRKLFVPGAERTASGDLDRIILKALEYRQEDRIDVDGFVFELKNYLKRFDDRGGYRPDKKRRVGRFRSLLKGTGQRTKSPKKPHKVWPKIAGAAVIWAVALLLTNVLFGPLAPDGPVGIAITVTVTIAACVALRLVLPKNIKLVVPILLALLIPAFNLTAAHALPTVGYALPANLGFSDSQYRVAEAHRAGHNVEADATQALSWYSKAADQGRSDAMWRIGQFYENGEGVIKDDVEAIIWYNKAADLGNADAQNSLGLFYKNGYGVDQDETVATGWFQKSAEQGNAESQCNLAYQYYEGIGADRDTTKAFEWAAKAAEQGNARAQCLLGLLYESGESVGSNVVYMVEWFQKSAEQGYAEAQYNLGRLYRFGKGVEQNDGLAVEWYRKAAEQGNAAAQNNLGYMYDQGKGVEEDDAVAVEWYRKAAEQGYVTAQVNLGYMYENGYGVEENDGVTVEWYRKAAEQGNATAQNNLGVMYKSGHGVEQNYAIALEWFRKAADNESSRAYYLLGNMYEDGTGVDIDTVVAREWYQKAADLEYNYAIAALQRLDAS